jgi:hypothetical protein
MTANTETERAKFDTWWREHGLGDYDTQLEAWLASAARRAPVVPQGWKLVPETAPQEVLEAINLLVDDHRAFDDSESFWYYLLAAAPQPPDSVPVQMPEPVGCTTKPWGVAWNTSNMEAGTPLYTEQQVRALLAQHNIT